MDLSELELQGLVPRSRWTRRGFVAPSLVTGFALSVQPISAETITTDSTGLVADNRAPAKPRLMAQSRHLRFDPEKMIRIKLA